MKHDGKSTGDEEYQYPNEEYVTETTPSEEEPEMEAKKPSRMAAIVGVLQNNKRVTAVIVVVVVVLVAFKLMGSHNKAKTIVKPQQPVLHQPVMHVSPVQQPSAPVASGQLNGLKQDAQTNQTAISQLQNQVQDLRSQLSQAEAQRTQLNQSMLVLVQEVKKLTSKVDTATAPKVVKKPVKPSAPPPPPVVYHLKAIVPGRAWIISNDGLSESVSVGDTVDQYGKVQAVDANRGMVMTSSGKVIDYGSNDH